MPPKKDQTKKGPTSFKVGDKVLSELTSEGNGLFRLLDREGNQTKKRMVIGVSEDGRRTSRMISSDTADKMEKMGFALQDKEPNPQKPSGTRMTKAKAEKVRALCIKEGVDPEKLEAILGPAPEKKTKKVTKKEAKPAKKTAKVAKKQTKPKKTVKKPKIEISEEEEEAELSEVESTEEEDSE